jgi:rubrerythrin
MENKELEVIKEAILNENEGYQVYTMAAEKIKDEEISKSFEKLADEELKHIDWLKDLYKSIEGTKEVEFSIEEISAPDKERLFKMEKIDKENLSFALSVFSIGVKMEKEAIDYYKDAAENTESKAAKDLYERIIEWEYQHLNYFEEQYEMLKDDWWSEQRFEPLF